MAAAPTANDLTRQQLDELDALLQRMLSLPTTSEPAAAPLAQAPALRLTQVPEAAPHRPPVFPPPPPMPAPEPTTPIIERKVVVPSTQIRSMPLPAAPRPAPVPDAPEAQPEAAAREPVSFLLWPFVGLNWLFDAVAGLFGPPGWILRSALGKNVLGIAGIGLLLYTAAHVGTVQGWFSLPFPIPWPK